MPISRQAFVQVATSLCCPCSLVVAVGGVDCSIRLLLGARGQGFREVCCLTGHADWVRSLAFTHWTPPHGQPVSPSTPLSPPPTPDLLPPTGSLLACFGYALMGQERGVYRM